MRVLSFVESMRLVDHHCHSVLRRDIDRSEFEVLLTEAAAPGGLGGTLFDSHIGLAVRSRCAPVLDLPPYTDADTYCERRSDLGADEVTARFLRGAGLAALFVDTGFEPEPMLSLAELGAAADAPTSEIVRLEHVAEQVAAEGSSAAGFADAVRQRLAAHAGSAVACKSIAAYRVGLALSDRRPADSDVSRAAGRWISAIAHGAPARLADEPLHRFLIFAGADLGLPVQIHVGYGDRDLDLHRCNPLLLTGLLRAIEPTGVPVMLLHNYPYHREAGYLAQVFSNVFLDIGLATHNVGRRATALLGEALELAPFGKVLYSSDGFGLPELHYLGAALFRRALSDVLLEGIAEDGWDEQDAARIAGLICAENARRAYRHDASPSFTDKPDRTAPT